MKMDNKVLAIGGIAVLMVSLLFILGQNTGIENSITMSAIRLYDEDHNLIKEIKPNTLGAQFQWGDVDANYIEFDLDYSFLYLDIDTTPSQMQFDISYYVSELGFEDIYSDPDVPWDEFFNVADKVPNIDLGDDYVSFADSWTYQGMDAPQDDDSPDYKDWIIDKNDRWGGEFNANDAFWDQYQDKSLHVYAIVDWKTDYAQEYYGDIQSWFEVLEVGIISDHSVIPAATQFKRLSFSIYGGLTGGMFGLDT